MDVCEHNKKIKCDCSYPCERHGKCCECVEYHRSKGELPVCLKKD